MSIQSYYSNLLIKQYNGLPNAAGTIQTLAYMVAMQNLPNLVQNGFNIAGSSGLAVGVQLDVIGKYNGVTRYGNGFNGQPITLDDSDFVKLIQLATARNFAGSSLENIQALLQIFFAGDILVFDYQNMSMSYLISTTLGSQNLLELFVTEGLLPKPMGVSLSVGAAPIITNFFGFQDARLALPPGVINNTGFNDATDYLGVGIWLDADTSVSA